MTAEEFLIKTSEDADFENRHNLEFKLIDNSCLNWMSSLEGLLDVKVVHK